jgi:hypothetical protein
MFCRPISRGRVRMNLPDFLTHVQTAQAIANWIKHSRFTAIPDRIFLAKIRLGLNGATRSILGFFINLNVDLWLRDLTNLRSATKRIVPSFERSITDLNQPWFNSCGVDSKGFKYVVRSPLRWLSSCCSLPIWAANSRAYPSNLSLVNFPPCRQKASDVASRT